MKSLLIISLIFFISPLKAQVNWSDFLVGTWQIDSSNVFESWYKVSSNPNEIKGENYRVEKGKRTLLEELTLNIDSKTIHYKARVLDQNNGQTIDFIGKSFGKKMVVSNNNHDFPKEISYTILSQDSILVSISDLKNKTFSFHLIRQEDTENPNYDHFLAKQLEANTYGMKPYFLVLLSIGKNTEITAEERQSASSSHTANIEQMVKEGYLVVAGPMGKNEQGLRGIFILQNLSSIDEVEDLLDRDEAIKYDMLSANIMRWYGPAALPLYMDYSEYIWQKKP